MTIESKKTLALKLRDIARDTDNQELILKEKGCIDGLINFLSLNDKEIVLISIQALYFISSLPKNRNVLARNDNLCRQINRLNMSLRKTSENLKLSKYDERIGSFARAIAKHLYEAKERIRSSEQIQNDKKVSSSTSTSIKIRETVESSTISNSNFKPKYLQTTRLVIKNMETESDRIKVEKLVLKMEGVISVTIDARHQRLSIYSTSTTSQQPQSSSGNNDENLDQAKNIQNKENILTRKFIDILSKYGFHVFAEPSFNNNSNKGLSGNKILGPHNGGNKTVFSNDDIKKPVASKNRKRGGYLDDEIGVYQSDETDSNTSQLSVYISGDGNNNTLESRLAQTRIANMERMKKNERVNSLFGRLKAFV